MLVDEASPFSARISAEGRNVWFCDIGDMVLYLREKKIDPAPAQVKDHASGAWIAASQAFYVSDPTKFRTPMGWGLAAFQDRGAASGYGDAENLATILKRIE
jgi:nitrous oxide reductase accessory protein NosL